MSKDQEAVRHIDDPLYKALHTEDVEGFNQARAGRENLPSLAHGDFRGLDLRGMDASGLDLRHAYFRGADIRGIDFSKARMEGASIAGAKISGCYFPAQIDPDEIIMSLNHGTRMRYRPPLIVQARKTDKG